MRTLTLAIAADSVVAGVVIGAVTEGAHAVIGAATEVETEVAAVEIAEAGAVIAAEQTIKLSLAMHIVS